ncbi:MAG: four helix bundle protein [Chloroflexi bacterium]|nr:four helix bundle protein [Chloroflexota bacterium]
MANLPHAGSYRGLIVYQKTRQLARDIFDITQKFPSEEKYSLTDQIRRSSRSIGAQIAESWGKRRYEKHFISKLTDAVSEQYETEHWLLSAQDCGYITQKEVQSLMNQCAEIGRMLNGMIDKADRFCQPRFNQLKEPSPE